MGSCCAPSLRYHAFHATYDRCREDDVSQVSHACLCRSAFFAPTVQVCPPGGQSWTNLSSFPQLTSPPAPTASAPAAQQQQELVVTCPYGRYPGQDIYINHPTTGAQFRVVIPMGVAPGGNFSVRL
jgi:hypothetical protein